MPTPTHTIMAPRTIRYTVHADSLVSVLDQSIGVDIIYEAGQPLPTRGNVATIRYGSRTLTGIVRSSNQRKRTLRIDV